MRGSPPQCHGSVVVRPVTKPPRFRSLDNSTRFEFSHRAAPRFQRPLFHPPMSSSSFRNHLQTRIENKPPLLASCFQILQLPGAPRAHVVADVIAILRLVLSW